MSAGFTVKTNTTPSPYGTTDKRYDIRRSPVFLVQWEDKDGIVHVDIVATSEHMCPAKFLRESGAKPNAIIEPVGADEL